MEIKKSGDRFFFCYETPHCINSEIIECKVDGESTKFKELTDAEANQHARWQLIYKDLEFAEASLIEFINRIKELRKHGSVIIDRRNTDSVILKSLIESAIVNYAKCFNRAEGRKVKLEIKQIFDTVEVEDHKKMHYELMDLRNKHIAHAGISVFEKMQDVCCA